MNKKAKIFLKILMIIFVFSSFTVKADENINIKEIFEITSKEYGRTLSEMAYNGRMYIAFEEYDNILRSSDGVNWGIRKFKDMVTDEQSKKAIYGMSNPIRVIWDGHQFIALHREGAISKSKDGVSWTSHKIVKEGFIKLSDIIYNGEKYILIGYDLDTYKISLFYSYDCTKWEKSEINEAIRHLFGERPLYTVAWNGKAFIAMGNAGAAAKSYDGEKWTGFDSKTNLEANRIIWDGNRYVVVGKIPFSLSSTSEKCDVGVVFTSEHGKQWKRVFSKKHTEFKDIEWNGDKYVVVGHRDNLAEDETHDWSSGILKSSSAKMICWDKGTLLTSYDGEKWSYEEIDFKFSTVISNNNGFLISGNKYLIKGEQEKYNSYYKLFYVDSPALLNNDWTGANVKNKDIILFAYNNKKNLKSFNPQLVLDKDISGVNLAETNIDLSKISFKGVNIENAVFSKEQNANLDETLGNGKMILKKVILDSKYKNEEWKIEFPHEVCKQRLKDVYVTDQKGNVIDVSLSVDDKYENIMCITPPYGGYKAKTIYYVDVSTISLKKNAHIKKYMLSFEIEESNNIVLFPDANLEKVMREKINKPYGDIYENDLRKIVELKISNIDISNLEGIQYLSELEVLKLENVGIEDIRLLKSLFKLKSLDLRGNKIHDIYPLKNLVNVKSLYLSRNKITDIDTIKKLIHVECLYLSTNKINNIEALKCLNNIKYLYLNGNEISDISPLRNLNNIEFLTLALNKIKDISWLSNLDSLEQLYLQNNQLHDITPLKNLKNIKALYLNGNKIKDFSPISEYYDKLKKKDFQLDN